MCRTIDFSALTSAKRSNIIKQYDSLYRYGRSKLANILFTRELSKRLSSMEGGDKVFANVFFPGNIPTDALDTWKDQLGSLIGGVIKRSVGLIGQDLEDGATTGIYLAAAKEIEDKSIRGAYYVPIAYPEKSSAVAEDWALGEELWMWSDNILNHEHEYRSLA